LRQVTLRFTRQIHCLVFLIQRQFLLNDEWHRIERPAYEKKETDAIFDNLKNINKEADHCSKTLRISIDTKAKVNLGDFSRGGKKEVLLHLRRAIMT
jgi:hypothetical protein